MPRWGAVGKRTDGFPETGKPGTPQDAAGLKQVAKRALAGL